MLVGANSIALVIPSGARGVGSLLVGYKHVQGGFGGSLVLRVRKPETICR
jgi:hypothetical protein